MDYNSHVNKTNHTGVIMNNHGLYFPEKNVIIKILKIFIIQYGLARKVLVLSITGIIAVSSILTASGPICTWELNEGKGGIVNDSSENNYTGTIIGKSVWTNGRRGSALYFDGNSYIDSGNISLSGTNTIEAWIFPEEWIDGSYQGIITKIPRTSPYPGWALYFAGYNNCMQIMFNMSGKQKRIETEPPRPKEWHHITVTIDSRKMSLFIDGCLVDIRDIQGTLSTNTCNLLIGALYGSGDDIGGFRGIIDEVKIYNKVLSHSEIIENAGINIVQSPEIKVTDYPKTLYSVKFPERSINTNISSIADWRFAARSATWGGWNWTPSADISSALRDKAEEIAGKFAARGVNTVFLDEHRYILVDDHEFENYLYNIKKAVSACHKYHLKIVLHLTVEGVLKPYRDLHPEQAVLDLETKTGAFYPRYGTYAMCPNDPAFIKAYCARLQAIMNTGLDGVMPDETEWLPPKMTICGCSYCREKFKKLYGFDIPLPGDKTVYENFDSPQWRAWVDFRIKSQGDILVKIKETVDKSGPEKLVTACQAGFLISSSSGMNAYGMDVEDMKRGLTAGFYESHLSSPWSWRYTAAEAGYYSAFGPVFILSFSRTISMDFFHWTFALANGLRYWTWPESFDLPVFPFLWEKKWETIITHNDPYCNVGILFSSPALHLIPYENINSMKKEYIGWCETLLEAHIPFETVAVSRITAESLQKYRILIAPATACLSSAENKLLRDFIRQGGSLIATLDCSMYDEKGEKLPDFGLKDVLGISYSEIMKEKKLEIHDNTGRKILYHGPFIKTDLAAGYVDILYSEKNGMPVITRRKYGKGNAFYCACGPGTQYFMPKIKPPYSESGASMWDLRLALGGVWTDNRKTEYKKIILGLIDRRVLPLDTDTPDDIFIRTFRHVNKNYQGVIVHMLNLTGLRINGNVQISADKEFEFLDYPDTGKISVGIKETGIQSAYFISPDFSETVKLPVTLKNEFSFITLSALYRYGFIYFSLSSADAVRDLLNDTPAVDSIPACEEFPRMDNAAWGKILSKNGKIIINISENKILNGKVDYTASVADFSPDYVDFYINEEKVHREKNAPYWCFGDNNKWDTTGIKNGKYLLKAAAVTEKYNCKIETQIEIEIKN
ncbi:MAG TPA: hypothetical protein DC049_18465 [Spirochaetia bacterium]|nr:hypothetical protein [Spirochaetia bacterium]